MTRTQPRSRRYRLGIASVIAMAAVIAYLVSIFMYSLSGRSDVTSAPPSVSDGVNLDIARLKHRKPPDYADGNPI